MDISGTYTFTAPPARVWQLLMDPTVIAACIPGCEALEPDGEDRYRARLKVALAAITGTYDGTVQISEKIEPQSYRLTVEGQGKPGFAKGSVLTGGAIARLGQRLIGSVSKMMQDRFFACLQTRL